MSSMTMPLNKSIVLSIMKETNYKNFNSKTIEELNFYCSETSKQHPIRIYPQFSSITNDEIINLINAFYYLKTPKLKELLVLLHFSDKRNIILKQLSQEIIDVYSSIHFHAGFFHTLIELDAIELLCNTYAFYNKITDLLELACKYGSFKVVKYLIKNHYRSHYNRNVKYDGYEDVNADLHRNNETPFQNSCESGNIELVEYLLNVPTNEKFDVSVVDVTNFPKHVEVWFKAKFPEFKYKFILNEMISDLEFLSIQGLSDDMYLIVDKYFRWRLTLEKMMECINNPEIEERINIVLPVFDGIYPTTVDGYLQVLTTLDFLQSERKFEDILRSLRSFEHKNEVLDQLNHNIVYRYNQLDNSMLE